MPSPELSLPQKPPKVVLVGPTNVGKSTLFNRLSHTRAAIVCDRPGVTVDRHEMRLQDNPLGYPLDLVDTGGVGPAARAHPLGAEIERAASAAIKEAAVILFVVDGTHSEPGVEEFESARWLRSQGGIDNKSIWVVANKADSKSFDPSGFYSLGFDRVLSLSAEHGQGVGELWDALRETLGDREAPEKSTDEAARIIVLGKPNVGKSTLLNAILGSERHVVSEMPGTTRDPIETTFAAKGGRELWRLVDTAGMRRPGRLERDVEWVAREKLKDLARKSDLAVLLIDANEGVSDLDAAIAGMAIDFGLSLVIALNKWDLMRGEDADDRWQKLQRSSDLKLDFLQWCPTVKISGLSGRGVPELMRTVGRVLEARRQRVQTSKLNQIFERRIRLHAHPLGPRGRPAKFYYLSQVGVSPPEFVVFANLPASAVHFSYKRFIQNTLRSEFNFEGTPLRLHFKVTRDG